MIPRKALLALFLTVAASVAIVRYDPTGSTGGPDASATPEGKYAHDGSWTSDAISARYGTLTVTIDISGQKITKVALGGSWDNNFGWRSGCSVEEYQNAALGLTSMGEVQQKVNVSFCSGATVSRTTYLKALQSALDKATY